MMAFMQYAMQIIMAFLMVIDHVHHGAARQRLRRANQRGAGNRTGHQRPGRSRRRSMPELKGVVEFQNVSFRYPGAEDDVLKNITFTARPGQTTAFIGSTGSGKSTLINLIPRFYDVTGGSVLVDGIDVRDVTQHDLREKIGYVSQKAVLFSGTIASNIKYANEQALPMNEVAQYAETAQALDFITASDQGLRHGGLPGRHQPVRRPETEAVHRPGAGQEAGNIYLR